MDEAFIKIEYVKKLYAEQRQSLVNSQRSLEEKDLEIQIKATEIKIKDDKIMRTNTGNSENVTMFKE